MKNKITLNGEAKEFENVTTLRDLMIKLSLNAPYLAVAINDRVIPRSEHEKTFVKDGDRLEVIHAVGGG